MQDNIKVEILDLTGDSDEEQSVKSEPLTPTKENAELPDSEPQESIGFQKSPSGRVIRNYEKCMDKAIADIKKGHSLIAVASQYGIPQEDLYSKIISRSLPRETDVLTTAEENSLIKWIINSNKQNRLILKQHLMEKVGKFKKVMNITPIFPKSKFGRMWYEYFMKNHPEIYENDGILMPSDRVLVHSMSQNNVSKQLESTHFLEDNNILTKDEEENLVNWIVTSNKNNSLIFKHQLMRRVGKLNKIVKSIPSFAKSKIGKVWYEKFLERHPEIYENDELLMPSENVKHPLSHYLSQDIKDAIVVLRDFRKDKNSPYVLNEKNVYVPKSDESEIEDVEKLQDLKSESPLELLDIIKSDLEDQIESGIESDTYFSNEEDHLSTETNVDFKGRKRKSNESIVCRKCSRCFRNKRNLKRHMLTHQALELRQVICVHCDKRFSTKCHLTVHMSSYHSEAYHNCEECGRYFKYRSSLRTHQRLTHEGREKANIFVCDMCKKAFKYKNSLEAHIIYGHMKEMKKFSCDICKKTFIKHSLMLRHKTRHSKIKPMECTHCSKTYSRKYLLREHLKNCTKYKKAIRIKQISDGMSAEKSLN